jgi:hypothetical protein
MLQTQQQTIQMRSHVWEWTHVLLVNTPCSHLHSFCTTGVSSGLATRVTSTRVSRGRLGEPITRGWTFLCFHFLYRSTCLLLGCVLNSTHCIFKANQLKRKCQKTKVKITSEQRFLPEGQFRKLETQGPKPNDNDTTGIWLNIFLSFQLRNMLCWEKYLNLRDRK